MCQSLITLLYVILKGKVVKTTWSALKFLKRQCLFGKYFCDKHKLTVPEYPLNLRSQQCPIGSEASDIRLSSLKISKYT